MTTWVVPSLREIHVRLSKQILPCLKCKEAPRIVDNHSDYLIENILYLRCKCGNVGKCEIPVLKPREVFDSIGQMIWDWNEKNRQDVEHFPTFKAVK